MKVRRYGSTAKQDARAMLYSIGIGILLMAVCSILASVVS